MAYPGSVLYINNDEKVFFSPMLPELVMLKSELIIGCVLEGDNEDVYPGGVLSASGFDDGFVEIDFLYVPEKERRKGIGRDLMTHLLTLMMNPELGIDSFQCSYVRNEHTRSLDAFLTSMGFEEDDGAETYEFTLGSLKKFPHVNTSGTDTTIRELGKLPPRYFNQLAAEIHKKYLSEDEETGVFIPLEDRSYYDQDYSFLYIDEDSNCKGGVLVSKQPWGYTLEYLCCLKSNGAKTVMTLLATLVKKGIANEPPDTVIRLSAVLKSAGDLLTRFCEDQPVKEGVAVTRVYSA